MEIKSWKLKLKENKQQFSRLELNLTYDNHKYFLSCHPVKLEVRDGYTMVSVCPTDGYRLGIEYVSRRGKKKDMEIISVCEQDWNEIVCTKVLRKNSLKLEGDVDWEKL